MVILKVFLRFNDKADQHISSSHKPRIRNKIPFISSMLMIVMMPGCLPQLRALCSCCFSECLDMSPPSPPPPGFTPMVSGKQWTVVAGVSIFMFRTIESPITRALSSGFSVGVSLSGENLFNVLIGMEQRCFDPRLGRLTVTQLPCCTGSSRTKQSTGLPELVVSRAVSTALTFLLSSTKV